MKIKIFNREICVCALLDTNPFMCRKQRRKEVKMTGHERTLMGRKAESIYTAWKKNHLEHEKKSKAAAVRQSVSSFEEHMKRNAISKACYVYINGISMPVISA